MGKFYCGISMCIGGDFVITIKLRLSSIQLVFAANPVMNLLKLSVA